MNAARTASGTRTRFVRLLGTLLSLTALAAAPLAAAKTDRIQLSNGTEMIGEVKSLEHGELRVSTDYMHTVRLDWQQVERVQSTLEFEVEVLDGARYFGKLAASEEDRVLVVTSAEEAVRLPYEQVLTLRQTRSTGVGKIDASIAVGFSFTQATDVTQGSLDGSYQRRTKRFSRSYHLLAILSDTADDTFSRGEFSFHLFRHLPGRWTWNTTASLQSNEQLGLEGRAIVTGSGQYRAIRTAIRELWLGAGLAGSREQFTGSEPSGSSLEALLSLSYFAFHFDDPELDVEVSFDLYPSLTTWGRLRGELSVDLSRELVSDLFWGLSLYSSFDTEPPGEDAERQDLAIVASLGWKY